MEEIVGEVLELFGVSPESKFSLSMAKPIASMKLKQNPLSLKHRNKMAPYLYL